MPEKVVVMVAIPGRIQRGDQVFTDLDYLPFARATWQWWCKRNDAELLVVDEPIGDRALYDVPPPMQRWLAVLELLARRPADTRFAVVDADTMIRWDCPDLFAMAGDQLGAVVDAGIPNWIHRSANAYQKFFPDARIVWWEYFNSGLVLMTHHHAPILQRLVGLYREHRTELEHIQKQADVGIDQTLLNFVVRERREPVTFLPRAFNHVGCFQIPFRIQADIQLDRKPIDFPALHAAEAFDFVKYSYVWHFTNGFTQVMSRKAAMGETWRTVRDNYPGSELSG